MLKHNTENEIKARRGTGVKTAEGRGYKPYEAVKKSLLTELTMTDEWYKKLANEIALKIKLHRCKLLTNYDFEVKLSSRLYEQGSDALKGWVCNQMLIYPMENAPFQFELKDNNMLKVTFPDW